MSSGHKN